MCRNILRQATRLVNLFLSQTNIVFRKRTSPQWLVVVADRGEVTANVRRYASRIQECGLGACMRSALQILFFKVRSGRAGWDLFLRAELFYKNHGICAMSAGARSTRTSSFGLRHVRVQRCGAGTRRRATLYFRTRSLVLARRRFCTKREQCNGSAQHRRWTRQDGSSSIG